MVYLITQRYLFIHKNECPEHLHNIVQLYSSLFYFNRLSVNIQDKFFGTYLKTHFNQFHLFIIKVRKKNFKIPLKKIEIT